MKPDAAQIRDFFSEYEFDLPYPVDDYSDDDDPTISLKHSEITDLFRKEIAASFVSIAPVGRTLADSLYVDFNTDGDIAKNMFALHLAEYDGPLCVLEDGLWFSEHASSFTFELPEPQAEQIARRLEAMAAKLRQNAEKAA